MAAGAAVLLGSVVVVSCRHRKIDRDYGVPGGGERGRRGGAVIARTDFRPRGKLWTLMRLLEGDLFFIPAWQWTP